MQLLLKFSFNFNINSIFNINAIFEYQYNIENEKNYTIITFFTFPQYHQDVCELQMVFLSLKPK